MSAKLAESLRAQQKLCKVSLSSYFVWFSYYQYEVGEAEQPQRKPFQIIFSHHLFNFPYNFFAIYVGHNSLLI